MNKDKKCPLCRGKANDDLPQNYSCLICGNFIMDSKVSCQIQNDEKYQGKLFIKKLHFDVEHYNFIGYNNPADLEKKLIDRIEARFF